MTLENPIPPHSRISIAADDEYVRRALSLALAGAGLALDGAVTDLDRTHRVASAPPAVLVLGADLTRAAGLAALRRARRDLPAARIVVVSTSDRGSMAARQALNGGGDAFVPYAEIERSLAAAVHASLAGLVCAPRQLRRLIVKPTFSHREKEVLELLVTGLTNHQIAMQLFVAESTVRPPVVGLREVGRLLPQGRRRAPARPCRGSDGDSASAGPSTRRRCTLTTLPLV